MNWMKRLPYTFKMTRPVSNGDTIFFNKGKTDFFANCSLSSLLLWLLISHSLLPSLSSLLLLLLLPLLLLCAQSRITISLGVILEPLGSGWKNTYLAWTSRGKKEEDSTGSPRKWNLANFSVWLSHQTRKGFFILTTCDKRRKVKKKKEKMRNAEGSFTRYTAGWMSWGMAFIFGNDSAPIL